ncbi:MULTISPECIES: DUF6221 family protein [unclassified Streptomyces]|uniref:DUF6221 family protein n=1 Tax=unclassified Streptomyces TaxID=2593676 RepID=UPI0040420897
MDELVVWLREQLDEDARIARAADAGRWEFRTLGRHDQAAIQTAGGLIQFDGSRASGNGVHTAVHNPACVLREIDAKRRLVARYVEHERLDRETFDAEGEHARSLVSLRAAYLDVVRELATVYADRPGYREERRV